MQISNAINCFFFFSSCEAPLILAYINVNFLLYFFHMGAAPRIRSRMQVGKWVRGSLTCWHRCRFATTGAWTCVLAWRTLSLFALPSACPLLWLHTTRHLPSWHWRQLLWCLSWPLTLKHMAPITQLAFRHRFLQRRSPHARTEVIVQMSGAGGWRAPPPAVQDHQMDSCWDCGWNWHWSDALICSHVFMDWSLFRIERAGGGSNIGGRDNWRGFRVKTDHLKEDTKQHIALIPRLQTQCPFSNLSVRLTFIILAFLNWHWLLFKSVLNCVLTRAGFFAACVLLLHTL